MFADIKRRFIITQLGLLTFFVWGVGFFYLVSTMLFNPVQLRWEMICFGWEAIAFGVPLIIFRPMLRSIERYAAVLESGRALGPEALAVYERQVLTYPFKVSIEVGLLSTLAYTLGGLQVHYFAQLPWEGVVVTILAGWCSGLLWAVLEYFLLEYDLRPLTALIALSGDARPRVPQVSLRMKIFACSIILVVTALGFFGLVAYTRAEYALEREIGRALTGRMRELATLVGSLPIGDSGGPSESWWMLAAEFPISTRGHFLLINENGRVMARHPVATAGAIRELSDEQLLPLVQDTVINGAEGYVTDRVGQTRIISYVAVPERPWKIVAVAPLRDFNSQVEQLIYSGLGAMAFAVVLALLIGLLTARSLTTSLGEVTRAAQAVADRRDLHQRVAFITNDEIGVLGRAFNSMAEGLQRYSEELEGLVAERTRVLELRTQQLATKNEELSDFLYVASHDLRAPLINLAGFSNALQDSIGQLDGVLTPGTAAPQWPALRDEIHESLDFIVRSVGKMDLLVNALLELSRIETRAHVEERIDTSAVVREIAATFRFQLDAKHIALTVDELPVIVADPVRIHQVFSNLIDNAIKYMPANGQAPAAARIDVGCEIDAAEYCFFVRDTGPGIRPQDREKIFRLFTRLDGSATTGDGVGLAAVKKIVEKHGGRVWVESELGHGSTFRFSIPRHGTRYA